MRSADLSLDECFRVLGLRPSAGGAEIKRAFRQLAKEHHPDLRHGRADRRTFIRIVAAYRRLHTELHLRSSEDNLRPCPSCGRAAELLDGADGRIACLDCLLGITQRRRALPLPLWTTVRHVGVIVLEAASLACFGLAVATGAFAYAVASLLTGVAALVVLALTCITVKHVKP